MELVRGNCPRGKSAGVIVLGGIVRGADVQVEMSGCLLKISNRLIVTLSTD